MRLHFYNEGMIYLHEDIPFLLNVVNLSHLDDMVFLEHFNCHRSFLTGLYMPRGGSTSFQHCNKDSTECTRPNDPKHLVIS
jgi:hypothetical protein